MLLAPYQESIISTPSTHWTNSTLLLKQANKHFFISFHPEELPVDLRGVHNPILIQLRSPNWSNSWHRCYWQTRHRWIDKTVMFLRCSTKRKKEAIQTRQFFKQLANAFRNRLSGMSRLTFLVSNHLGSSKLVWIIGRFQTLGEGGITIFDWWRSLRLSSNYRNFEKLPKFDKLGFYCTCLQSSKRNLLTKKLRHFGLTFAGIMIKYNSH